MQEFIVSKVPEDPRDSLIHPDSAKVVMRAMFSLKKDKAPGPDGFNAAFFHKNWAIVGTDVVMAVQSFCLLRNGMQQL